MSEKMLLRMENVTMQFGGVVAVNNLSLDVPEGKIVALIGPNGAGKTTAFNCITGVYQPTNGRVEFDGETYVCAHPTGKMKKNYLGQNGDVYTSKKNMNPNPDKVVKLGIARTFQNIRLWKTMTVFENVLVAKHMRAKQNVFSAIFRGNTAWISTRTKSQPVCPTVSSAVWKSPVHWQPSQSFCCWMNLLRA